MRMYTVCTMMMTCILLFASFSQGAELTALERDFGQSFETIKTAQIINPEAGKNMLPPLGMEGKVADTVMKGYYKTFEKVEPQITNIINIGGGSGGG